MLLQGSMIHQFHVDRVVGQLNAIKPGVGAELLETEHLCLYLHGDIFSGPEGEPLSALAQAYQNGTLAEALAQANGYFSLFIFDKQQQRIICATDRYGMKPVYFWQDDSECFAVSSELKTIAANPAFNLSIDKAALEAFTECGHMLEDQTWFAHTKRLDPATMITIDVVSGQFELTPYWCWSNITKSNQLSFEQATDKLHELYVQAMSRCLSVVSTPTLAITLSGGLDSRVLLAEAVKQYSGTIESFTFGIEGCADGVIAKQVSDIAGVKNHFRPIDPQTWFAGRDKGVWTSEGMFNLVHMHTLASVESISQFSPYLLNGYLGGAIIGGSYLLSGEMNKKPDAEIVARKYGQCAQYIDLNRPYYDFECTDPVLIANRGVRFIASGSDLLSDRLHNLKPFMDIDLVDFLYSLPDEYRHNARLYSAMLLKYYPEYFASIPWQNTGKVITVDWQEETSERANPSAKQRLINCIKGTRFESFARRLHIKLNRSNKNYASYPKWMREPAFAEYLTQTLSQPFEVGGKTLLDNQDATQALQRFMKDYTIKPETVGGWLTFALYLKAVDKARAEVAAS